LEKLLEILLRFLPYGCTIVLVVGSIYGILQYKRLSFPKRILSLFLIVSLLFDIVSKSHGIFNLGSNIYLFLILSLFEFMVFTAYYLHMLSFEKQTKRILQALQLVGGLAITYIAAKSLLLDNLERIAEVSGTLKMVVHLIIIILALHIMIHQVAKERVSLATYGILFYYVGSIIIFYLLPQLVSTSLIASYAIWTINSLLLMGFYIACILEIRKWKKDS